MGSDSHPARGATPNKSQPVQTLGVRTPVEIMLSEPRIGDGMPDSNPAQPAKLDVKALFDRIYAAGYHSPTSYAAALEAERDRLRLENEGLRDMLEKAHIYLCSDEFLASLDGDDRS